MTQEASGTLCGMGAGFTSFVSHAGTPPFQMHMLPQRLDKTLYVGTGVMFFAALNFFKSFLTRCSDSSARAISRHRSRRSRSRPSA